VTSDSLTNYALTSSLANYVTSSSLTTTLANFVTVGMASEYVVLTTLATILDNYALTSSLANYVTSSSLTTTLGSYALTSSLATVSNRVTSLETKTTSLSYNASATTISNALRLPMGMSIDPTNTIVYYGTNVSIQKWWVAPWSSHVNDALILLDHINTTVYGNEVRMIDGRLNLFRHPGAWSHGVYVNVHLVHFGTELVPQIANISYVSYNVDGTEPHAREPRLALVTHTASSKQYLALHVPFYVNSGRVHFSGIMSTLSESIPMTMCLPSDGYTIDQSPYDVYARKQEWNHGLRCTGVIEAPNVVALETKASGFNVDGTELTLTKLNGLSMNDYALTSSLANYVTSSSLTTTLANYATIGMISDFVNLATLSTILGNYVTSSSLASYALTSSLTAVSDRVTTLETKTSRLSYTAAMLDLLTISSNVKVMKTISVGGTTRDSVSISCTNGKVVATNVTLTNKDDIDALKLKTSGFNADGSELTVTKLNNVLVSDYAMKGDLLSYATTGALGDVVARVASVESKVVGFSANGSELTLTKLNGTNVTEYVVNDDLDDYATLTDLNAVIDDVLTIDTRTSGFNTDGSELTLTKLNGYAIYSGTVGSGIPAAPWIPGIKTDGVMEVGRMIDFHTDNATGGTDNTCRVTCTGNSLSIPNISVPGSVTVTGTVSGSNITTLTNKVSAVETKTTGISYSSGTTTIDSVPKIGSESLIDLIYPVGTVYQSSVASFNPNTKWGGTWVKIEGRFLFGSDTTRTVGTTGGTDKVTIESRHLPDHTHPYSFHSVSFVEEKIQSITNTTRLYANGATVSTGNTGGWRATSQIDQLDIMPSYMVVNIWHRTA